MAHTDWMIRGPEISTCNCSYGCPCQFNALPTDGTCRAAVGMHIEKGHHGKVKLDGLNWAATAAWPGPIHMGHGEIQPIVDERATLLDRDDPTRLRVLRRGPRNPHGRDVAGLGQVVELLDCLGIPFVGR